VARPPSPRSRSVNIVHRPSATNVTRQNHHPERILFFIPCGHRGRHGPTMAPPSPTGWPQGSVKRGITITRTAYLHS